MLPWKREIFYSTALGNSPEIRWYVSSEGLVIGVYHPQAYPLEDTETLEGLRSKVNHEDFRFYDFRKYRPVILEDGNLHLDMKFLSLGRIFKEWILDPLRSLLPSQSRTMRLRDRRTPRSPRVRRARRSRRARGSRKYGNH